MEPRLLALDSPTQGLDPITTAQVAKALRAGTKGLDASAVVVTHDIATAFGIADHLALLDEGRIAAFGVPQVLLKSSDPRLSRFFHAYRDRLQGG